MDSPGGSRRGSIQPPGSGPPSRRGSLIPPEDQPRRPSLLISDEVFRNFIKLCVWVLLLLEVVNKQPNSPNTILGCNVQKCRLSRTTCHDKLLRQ